MDRYIESLIDDIINARTKKYFMEVVQTYYSGCYRSSVVSLFTCVIVDLVFKLEVLRDEYYDEKAYEILENITSIQKDNPKKSEWEMKMVENIYKLTSFLEPSDYINIELLQKHRHLSAHPVLDRDSILFEPNKEIVKAHIINMLIGVFTKPPILSLKIFNSLIEDLAQKRELFVKPDELNKYLALKYFKNLREPTIIDIFKHLSKFIFCRVNDDYNRNRDINFKAIIYITEEHYDQMLEYVRVNPMHFLDLKPEEPTNYFIQFLALFPKFYKIIDDSVKGLFKSKIESDINLQLISWFEYDSFYDYYNVISTTLVNSKPIPIQTTQIEMAQKFFKECRKDDEWLSIVVLIYKLSPVFSHANHNFETLIQPNLDLFNESHFVRILDFIENEFQLHGRNAAESDHALIIEKIKEKNININLSEYKKLWIT